jgi:hypothetical protein
MRDGKREEVNENRFELLLKTANLPGRRAVLEIVYDVV